MTDIEGWEAASASLAEILELDVPLKPETPLRDLDMDSLDIMEWMFDLGIDGEEVFDDEVIEALPTMSLGQLYALMKK